MLNHISDHQFLFTYIEKLSYIEKVPKFVDIEKTDANSLENFIQELNDVNIYDQLLRPIDSCPYAALKATFKQYRETLRSSIKEAKRLYYHRTFLLYQNNVRKTWSVIKETLQRKKKT